MRYKLPTPLLGVDTVSAISEMKEGYARRIDNYFVDREKLSLRKGYNVYHQLQVSGNVKTLIPFNDSNKLIACCSGNIIDAMADETLASDLTNDEWYWSYYNKRIFMCNNSDNAKVYDGTTLSDITFTGSTDLIFASVGQANNQLIFIKDNDVGFYYGGVGNISGDLSYFDLSQIAKKGGKLLAVASWGKDSSQGYNKYTAFITNEGEIIVYEGNDFSNPESINLVGNFFTHTPIGRNCVMNWGADIIIITENGYIPMSEIVNNGEIIKASTLFSDMISGYVLERARQFSSAYGWKSLINSREHFALFNVPFNNTFEQHIMNIDTGAWSRFTGLNSFDWANFDDKLLFGSSNGQICQYNTYSDNNSFIYGYIENVYSKLGTEEQKLLGLFNTRIEADADVAITYSLGIDYQLPGFEYTPSASDTGFVWAGADTDPIVGEFWDDGSWTGGVEKLNKYRSISGYCNSASLGLKTQTSNIEINIYETIFNYEISQGAL